MIDLTADDCYSLDACTCGHTINDHRVKCSWCGCLNDAREARYAAAARFAERRVLAAYRDVLAEVGVAAA